MSDTTKKNFITPWGRLSFCNLFTPRPTMDGKSERYSSNLIMQAPAKMTSERQKAAIKELHEACVACAKEFFGEKVNMKNIRMPIRSGEDREYEGYGEGTVFINPWSKQKPGIIDQNKEDVDIPADVFPGQVARLSVRPFGYDTSGNKGVALALNNVQVRLDIDAPRLDGRMSAEASFADADDTGADDLAKELGADVTVAAKATGGDAGDVGIDDLMK